MDDWLAAEQEVNLARLQPKPPGTVTTEEYANLRGCSQVRAGEILRLMHKVGKVTKQPWLNGKNGRTYVYGLNGKK